MGHAFPPMTRKTSIHTKLTIILQYRIGWLMNQLHYMSPTLSQNDLLYSPVLVPCHLGTSCHNVYLRLPELNHCTIAKCNPPNPRANRLLLCFQILLVLLTFVIGCFLLVLTGWTHQSSNSCCGQVLLLLMMSKECGSSTRQGSSMATI